ncbi:unnamed protein product [Caenorhabditis auriculariae]|uniref:Uncharacterized protein n=1 Tax=Caenorhabditis auriculariae TaxID=2777116 RepID=A0A8S1H3C1_9PELO|nr:unnamed protein product [Caenorhabditis auriculariae]
MELKPPGNLKTEGSPSTDPEGGDAPMPPASQGTPSGTEDQPPSGSSGQSKLIYEDTTPLERTPLGNAVDNLMIAWLQILKNVATKSPVQPPSTLDHVKEVAEVCSKHWRDACVDLCDEFARIMATFEMDSSEESLQSESKHLDLAIERQEAHIKRVKETLEKQSEEYFKTFPEAGKYYFT